MNSITRIAAQIAAHVFMAASVFLAFACGGSGTHQQSSDGVCCRDLSSSRVPLPACDPEWDPEWDPDCGATEPGSGTVTVTFVNALPVQATFYADGGGELATTSYHESIWLPAGGKTERPDAMGGTLGMVLATSTMLAAEGFPHYTITDSVTLTQPFMSCTITAEMHAEGYAYLTQACR